MKRESGNREGAGIVALVVLSLAITLPVEAQEVAAPETLGAMGVQGGTITFRSTTGNGLSLTVVGDGFRSVETFRGGQTPTFAPVDRRGFMIPDGVYTWELVENPRLPAANAKAEGKPANGRATHQVAAQAGRRQFGSFSILNGLMVDSTLAEEHAGPMAMPYSPTSSETQAPAGFDDTDAAAQDGR